MNQQPAADHGAGTPADGHCVITETWIGRTAVIRVSGEVDALTAPGLEQAIASSLEQSPTAVVVDLSDVDFLASAGMAVLVGAREKADGEVRFGVVADGPATSRPLHLVGLADLVGLHATLDEALAGAADAG